MFWARTDAIRPLLEAGLQWSDFPPELGQTDGTLAHCIERMLGVVPTSRHYLHGVIRDTRTPSWSRWRLNQFIDRPFEHIKAAIADPEIQIVAFDIFDTLLTRPLLDADFVKHLLQTELENEGIHGFRENRVRAEQAARESKRQDVDIYDIYQNLTRFQGNLENRLTPEREIELEARSVRPRQEVVALLEFAARSGKKIVLASDMFLPRQTIEDMLERCEIRGWDALYLSSQVGVRKDSGKLYEHILEKEALAPGQMVMIGDNERSDFQIPADMGICAIHVVKPQNIMRAMPRFAELVPDAATAPLADQFLFGSIASEIFGGITYPHFSPDNMFGISARLIGYGLLGPITVAFSQWLLDQAQENGIERLYFLAREGKFLKTVFDRWQSSGLSEDQGSTWRNIASEYLLISRRAITVPCIQTIEDIFAIAESNDFYGAPMTMFLDERFGTVLDDATWLKCEDEKVWSRDALLTIEGGNIDHIRHFLRVIAPYIFRQANVERQNALRYCNDMGLVAHGGKAVVDVGYGATIQRHLIKLLDQKIDGLYMMTDRNGAALELKADVMSKGCFVNSAERLPTSSPLFIHSFILEKMLSSDDEQVIRYTPAGAQFRHQADDTNSARNVRHEMQQGALDFVAEAVRFRDEMSGSLQISKAHCEALFSSFVTNMSEREREIFSSLVLDDFYCGRGIV